MEHRWQLWRQDDNGQKFMMGSTADREEAQRSLVRFEARGHKQTYWIVDGHSGKSPDAEAEGG